ncbi:MAG: T9SS type A sorting domain-containing protein [Bacteroidales bacterium]|nr:T9SS type A sorting domain-containing protein [Bacteroidales bacterium]
MILSGYWPKGVFYHTYDVTTSPLHLLSSKSYLPINRDFQPDTYTHAHVQVNNGYESGGKMYLVQDLITRNDKSALWVLKVDYNSGTVINSDIYHKRPSRKFQILGIASNFNDIFILFADNMLSCRMIGQIEAGNPNLYTFNTVLNTTLTYSHKDGKWDYLDLLLNNISLNHATQNVMSGGALSHAGYLLETSDIANTTCESSEEYEHDTLAIEETGTPEIFIDTISFDTTYVDYTTQEHYLDLICGDCEQPFFENDSFGQKFAEDNCPPTDEIMVMYENGCIVAKGNKADLEYQIFDYMGRLIDTGNIEGEECIRVSTYKESVYFVHLYNSKISINEKLYIK